MIRLDVNYALGLLDRAKKALTNGDSTTARNELEYALTLIAEHQEQRFITVAYLDDKGAVCSKDTARYIATRK